MIRPAVARGIPDFSADADLRRLTALIACASRLDPVWVVTLEVPGAPVAKGRARRARAGHHYTPTRTRRAETELAWAWRAACAGLSGLPLDGNLSLAVLFYLPTERRIDSDNLVKLVLDAGTKAGIWQDDSQITGGPFPLLELDRVRPRTLIALGPHVSTLDRWSKGRIR